MRTSAIVFRDLAFPSTEFGYAPGTDGAGAATGILARTQHGGADVGRVSSRRIRCQRL